MAAAEVVIGVTIGVEDGGLTDAEMVEPSDAQALADALVRQIGPDTLSPQDRAADYDRSKSLDAYANLIAELYAR